MARLVGLEGPEYLAWLRDQPEADYTVLIGANTYRLMSGLATDGEPGTDALAGLSKIVFSSTLTEPLSWRTHDWSLRVPSRPCAR